MKNNFFRRDVFGKQLFLIFWTSCCFFNLDILPAQDTLSIDNTIAIRPNIVLILVDDAALMDFGCYGGEAATPNIDRLAKRGTMLTNYHTSPMCAPSRAMLLTGYDSHLTGVPNLPLFTSPEYATQPGYEGVLNDKVLTVGTRLKKNGYHTLVTGKWHLGHSEDNLPNNRGFDHSYILDASGADNYENRPYLPTQDSKVPWFKNGKKIDLPEDFYSSRNLVDEMIGFMKEIPEDGNPFFSLLSFQAIHIPVQVPKEFTEKYIDTYMVGWDVIRQQRYEKAKKLGIIPPDAALGDMLPVLKKWDSLTEEEKQYKAKAMAVNAGMLEAMDYHIGRYIQYLEENNQFDNTVFIITSDNGPEASASGDVRIMQYWLNWVGYHQDYERLGEKASFNYIGAEFASAAASPSSFFKFYGGEGGLRVPLIFSGPSIPVGQSIPAFSMVTDVTPTILSIAGIDEPMEAPAGPMTGKNLYPLLKGDTSIIYGADEPVGLEAAGRCVLYKGNMKLVKTGKPYGDYNWKLFDLAKDPGEINDLKEAQPKMFAEMVQHYTDYAEKFGVLAMPEDYEPFNEILGKVRMKWGKAALPWLVGLLVVIIGLIFWKRKCKTTL